MESFGIFPDAAASDAASAAAVVVVAVMFADEDSLLLNPEATIARSIPSLLMLAMAMLLMMNSDALLRLQFVKLDVVDGD